MRGVVSTLLAATGLLAGQTAVIAPPWLVPYPGASVTTNTTSALIESSYAAPVQPEHVSGHYTKLFAANGLTPQSSYDGIGTVIRASAPECDLLIKIRESSSGSSVKVACASKQASAPYVAFANPVISTTSTGTSGRGHLKSAAEIQQYNEQRAREIQAEREAFERNSTAMMQQYDKPAYPQSRTSVAANLAPSAPIASYRNDAPALVWPSWLGSVRGERLSQPTQNTRGPESSLSRKYLTNVAMTEIEQFYKQALESNGFKVDRSSISTGSTSTGVKQNASGDVEGYRGEGSGINPPTTTVRVSFSRMFLNEPITVHINVSVRGSFGR